tara:strand:+ start:1992 stop:2351 length:360 start_codon:yes stop_codon:yes gene_type:complete
MNRSINTKRTGAYKAGPGRPPGRKNNKTLELEKALGEAVEGLDDAFEGDAHAFLQMVYRNPKISIDIRIQAAGRALRVEKPTLSSGRSELNINVDIASRLEIARKRVADRFESSKIIDG